MTTTPTNIQPPNDGLVLTDYPELRALVAYTSAGLSEQVTVTWQVASNASFTTNLQSITSDQIYSSGQVARMPITTGLSTGTWYVRARSRDLAGVDSAYSGTNSFTIAHVPYSTDRTPAHGSRIPYGAGSVTFTWQFADQDPGDVQTAYQIKAYKASDDALLFDTTKLTSTAKTHSQPVAVQYQSGYYYWQMRVWDFYNIASDWSEPTLFQLGVEPIAMILQPTAGVPVSVPNPTVTWSFFSNNAAPSTYGQLGVDYTTYTEIIAENADYEDLLLNSPDQAGQTHYRVVVKEGLYTVHDSGWIAGSNASYVLPSIIHQGVRYDVRVSVRDTGDYEGTSSAVSITGAWPGPDTGQLVDIDIDHLDDPAVGAVQITWQAEIYDPTFVAWRVYRRALTGANATINWQLVGVSYATTGRGEVLDYLFEPGRTYQYAVVQAALRYFDEEVESTYEVQTVTPVSTKYWLIHPSEDINVMLSHVVSDSFSEVYETYEANVINRGRRIEYGTRYGYDGSLTAHLRDLDSRGSAIELEEIQRMKRARSDMYLRVPFGYVWRVGVMDISVNRMAGVGLREFAEITLPYKEVA